MLQENDLMVPTLLPFAEIIVSAMHQNLSNHINQRIAISKSMSIFKPLIVPIEDADVEYISIEDFLVILDARMKDEAIYKEEILQLKEKICEEFNKLLDENSDQQFIDFVSKERQAVLKIMADCLRIDEKMVAENFFKDMMNGFEREVLELNNFEKTVNTLFWKPLLTPFPIEALNKLRQLIKELGNEKSKNKIRAIASSLAEHIKEYLEPRKIKDIDFSTTEKLKLKLEKLAEKRQKCNIELQKIAKNQNTVKMFLSKCADKIKILADLNEFFDTEITIKYEELELIGKIKVADFKKIFYKMPITTSSLCVRFKSENLEDFESLKENLLKLTYLKWLTIDFSMLNEIGIQEAKSISNALKYLTNISALSLNFQANTVATEGVKALSTALRELKNISILNLNLRENDIETEGVKALSTALAELNNISTLNLNLWQNKIEEGGAEALSFALKELKNISTLDLNLRNNNIKAEGAKVLSISLKDLTKISILTLNFGNNTIGTEGLTTVSIALKELINIISLNMNLQKNKIEADGWAAFSTSLSKLHGITTLILDLKENNIQAREAQSLANALKQLKNILILNLDIEYNNIEADGARAMAAALNNLTNISTLILDLKHNNIQSEELKAVSAMLKDIKNMSAISLNLQIEAKGRIHL